MNFPRSALARVTAVVILATFAGLLPQLATAQNNRLAGTWKLLPDKSTFTPGPARYQSMTLTIPGSGDPVMNIEGVDAQGRPVKGSYTAVPDGKPHPITGIPAFDSGTWTRQNDSVVSYQYSKGRGIAALGTRALSPDGSTLTFREQIYDDKGKQTGIAVMVFLNPDVMVASATPPPDAPPPPPKPVFTPQETAALAVLDKNDNDEAIRQFTAIIDAKPPSPMLYYDYGSRGIAYLRKGQQDQALADFDSAIKLKPDDGDSHFRRGAIKFGQMQYQAAIDDLSVAVQADPMNADAFNMRSFSYYRLQQTEKGAADTEKACALKKEYCVN
jgi:tetratricopeptide repeat protein